MPLLNGGDRWATSPIRLTRYCFVPIVHNPRRAVRSPSAVQKCGDVSVWDGHCSIAAAGPKHRGQRE